MKNEENTKYIKAGLTAAAVVTFGILLYFIFSHIGNLSQVHHMLSGILRPFLYGGVIAYLVTPLSRNLGKLFKKPQGCVAADALALLIAIVGLLCIIGLIVPQFTKSLIGIFQSLPREIERTERILEEAMKNDPTLLKIIRSFTDWIDGRLKEVMSGDIDKKLEQVLGVASGAVSTATGIFSGFTDFLIGLIIAFYILTKRAQLAAQATLIIRAAFKNEWADWILDEARLADKIFNGFFIGKIVDSAIVGVICFIGCVLMRFEAPLLIAVIVGVTNIIPFFGPYIGAVPCALILVLQNPTHCIMFVVFIVILQQIDGNVIGPKILGDSTGLPALWVMFGILLFGGLWGIVGMLVGVPLMALIYDIIKQTTYNIIRKKGREDMIVSYNERFHPARQKKGK